MDKLYWIVCEEGDLTLFEGRHQARTRGAALKFLKEQVGRTCLRGLVFTITEIPVPLIREMVTEVLSGFAAEIDLPPETGNLEDQYWTPGPGEIVEQDIPPAVVRLPDAKATLDRATAMLPAVTEPPSWARREDRSTVLARKAIRRARSGRPCRLGTAAHLAQIWSGQDNLVQKIATAIHCGRVRSLCNRRQ